MPITRTTLLGGPAAVTFAGHTFFAHDGIDITPALEIDSVDSDAQGQIDATATAAPVTIKFIPSAPFADLAALYPHADGRPGKSLFGSADAPLVLTGANGVRLTFIAVAILAMPDLHLTTRGPVAGTVTFLALRARSLSITAANRLVKIDTAAIPLPPRGTPQLADDFLITWGTGTPVGPWLDLRSRDGVRIHFKLTAKPVLSDANALLDLTLDKLGIEARFTPATPNGPDESTLIDALSLQGANAKPGRSLSATAAPLRIRGEHLHIEFPSAQLTAGSLAFDATHPRLGELTFRARRAWLGTGLSADLLTLTEGES